MDNELDYWAALDTRKCADEVVEKAEGYFTFCASRGWFDLWRRLYYAYNPNRYTRGRVQQAGESGEFTTLRANHFKNILEHIQTLSITDRPAWQPQSVNSDSRSQKQCIIAEGILDYYMRERRVERHLFDATRNALLFSEGFVSETWDTSMGEVISEDEEGNKVYDGDIRYSSHEPVDVVRDVNLRAFNQRSWLILRTYENKYELAAKYPEYAKEITAQQTGITAINHYLGSMFMDRSTDSDIIPIYTFYHVKSASVPQGRQMTMLTDGTVLTDSILLYPHLPIHRIAPANQVGTPMGMSVSFDLLPLQEMYDAHYTTLLSINEQFSIPKILMPTGSGVSVDALQNGFLPIMYSTGKPEVMMMPTAPPGLYQAMEKIKQDMETLSGVNSVSRGQPEASLKSGSALALVQSMAIQFNAPLQQSYIQLLEDVGTATINILQDYADSPRIVQIAGKRNKGIIQQSFSSEDIDGISRVQVQVGNPMAKTVSGRLSIAESLLSNKIISSAQEYLMVLETGQLEPLTQGASAELLNLASENELLGEGTPVPVLFTDNHVLHIQEHSALASDPIVRSNPEQFGIISQHIIEHLNSLSDPAYQNYRQLMGQPSLAGATPTASQATAPGTQANPVMNPGQPMNGPDVQQMAANVQPPQPPANALTGERAPLPQPV